MKKYLGIIITILLISNNNVFAQSNCKTNAAGDVICPDIYNSNVFYTTPSTTTLTEEAKSQAIIDQQAILERQQQALNKQALQEIIANQIANDPKLSAQQTTITKSLNALQSQAK